MHGPGNPDENFRGLRESSVKSFWKDSVGQAYSGEGEAQPLSLGTWGSAISGYPRRNSNELPGSRARTAMMEILPSGQEPTGVMNSPSQVTVQTGSGDTACETLCGHMMLIASQQQDRWWEQPGQLAPPSCEVRRDGLKSFHMKGTGWGKRCS